MENVTVRMDPDVLGVLERETARGGKLNSADLEDVSSVVRAGVKRVLIEHGIPLPCAPPEGAGR